MVDLGSLVLLMSIFGWKVAVLYVIFGLVMLSKAVKIKLLGMFQNTIDILAEKNIAADCQHVTDLQQIMTYGVMSLPGLVINDKVVSYGRILSKADIQKFIESDK